MIENIVLARRIYNTHQLYSFINLEEIGEVIKILSWLQKLKMSGITKSHKELLLYERYLCEHDLFICFNYENEC